MPTELLVAIASGKAVLFVDGTAISSYGDVLRPRLRNAGVMFDAKEFLGEGERVTIRAGVHPYAEATAEAQKLVRIRKAEVYLGCCLDAFVTVAERLVALGQLDTILTDELTREHVNSREFAKAFHLPRHHDFVLAEGEGRGRKLIALLKSMRG